MAPTSQICKCTAHRIWISNLLIGQIYIMTDTDAGDRLLLTLVPTNQKSMLLSTNHKPGFCKLSGKTAADCPTEPHLIRSFTLRLPVVALVGWPDSAPSENFRQLPQYSRTERSEYREISIVLWKIARGCLQI